MSGIYVHIPFCKQACFYCDFHFSTNQTRKTEMGHALMKELTLQKAYLAGHRVETIYFGGGTPSLLEPAEIKAILQTVHTHYHVAPAAEITLEANPDDLSPDVLKALRGSGINRLSIGIQSFHDDTLVYLNRAHTASSAVQCIRDARLAGFDNISIDLIYAIPGQSDHQWKENIRQAIALNPEHISAYALTIEEKTPFGRWAAKGKLSAVEDDTAASQLILLIDALEREGYEHYEVSNFAKPGFISNHNSNYWRQQPYLGIGPSAHSYNLQSRQFNVSNNAEYLRQLTQGVIPCTIETLTPDEKINDYLLTRLRTRWGIDLRELKLELGYDLQKVHNAYVTTLVNQGLAVLNHETLTLTRSGKLLADKISADLFAVRDQV